MREALRPMAKVPLSFLLLFLLPQSLALPMCTDLMWPITLNISLSFCGITGSSCCNTTDDAAIQAQFQSLNITDSTCGGVMKSILCAKCSPYSGDLFDAETKLRTVPFLCNSTSLSSSSASKEATNDFCKTVWDTCSNVSMLNSPFSGSSSKLADVWKSETDFCASLGGSSGDETLCFNGQSAAFNATAAPPAPKGLCIEKLDNGSYINLAPHPDGSNRIFLSNLPGEIWLATVPEVGSGEVLGLDQSNPFLDLTDEVTLGSEFGLLGLAFHPNFASNGRFFVSYSCDNQTSKSCYGKCSCFPEVGCDPATVPSDNGALLCQYQSVISEFTVNGSSATPSNASTANPSEVRRIFTMGLPFQNHHGGQILFGPDDGYMYFMMGDGGNVGDPYNFAQNKKSLLGKIMRLDVNNMPSQSDIDSLSLWGNYSLPADNPFPNNNDSRGEIWALGLRNPWRCSFDYKRPSYFFCGDVGQILYEEVDLITKGGNYGWRVYEGPNLYHSPWTPGGNTSVNSINAILPVTGYYRSAVNSNDGSASVTGGFVYRSMTDPCMYGRYLYADLFAQDMWANAEVPENSGNYTTNLITFSCATDSPIPCDTVPGSPLPSLGYIFSFGEDNRKDIFLLTSSGLYRVVQPSRCGYSCPLENVTSTETPSSPSSAYQLRNLSGRLLTVMVAVLLLLC